MLSKGKKRSRPIEYGDYKMSRPSTSEDFEYNIQSRPHRRREKPISSPCSPLKRPKVEDPSNTVFSAKFHEIDKRNPDYFAAPAVSNFVKTLDKEFYPTFSEF